MILRMYNLCIECGNTALQLLKHPEDGEMTVACAKCGSCQYIDDWNDQNPIQEEEEVKEPVEPLDQGEDLMTLDEFTAAINATAFTDDDGMGVWADKEKKLCYRPETCVIPSEFIDGKSEKPEWATHVVWYNKW
jgi:hypothetical protein